MAKVIGKDEDFSRSTTVNGKKVTVVRAVKPDEESKVRFAVTWTLDFSKCSEAEILELATSSAVIDLQRKWRLTAEKDRAKMEGPVDVKSAIVDAARRQADPMVALMNKIKGGKLKKAEVLEMLKGIKE